MNERGVIYMTWKDAVGLALEDREEGYNFLYQQTYQKSYYVALKYMKQEEEAADVLQDAIYQGISESGPASGTG